MISKLTKRIGFIGSGQMTEALVGGLIKSGTSTKDLIISSNPSEGRRKIMQEKFGIETYENNLEIMDKCDNVIISVKPHIMGSVLDEIKHCVTDQHFVASIVAGKPLKCMEKKLGPDARTARLMVNTPALVGKMAGGYTMGKAATKED
jgi:pyrroline-5-carboxylate reductase